MNEFDQFIKHTLKVRNYIRYTDDFIIISESAVYLQHIIPKIQSFLKERLMLEIHPKKIGVRKYTQGIDFLGYVIFPHYILVRKKTKKRIVKNLKKKITCYKDGLISRESLFQTLQSYLGVLSHADEYDFSNYLKNQFWFWLNE